MTEEIKEILSLLNSTSWCNESKQLLNYITNLQQELQKANDTLDTHNELIEKLQQDIDKANDIIEKDRQFYKFRMDEYVDLKKENEKLQITVNNCKQENEILRKNAEHNDKVVDKARWNEMIYKSRCEKANKIITDFMCTEEYCNVDPVAIAENYMKIQKALNGNDENE